MFHSSNLYLGRIEEHCKKDKGIVTSLQLEIIVFVIYHHWLEVAGVVSSGEKLKQASCIVLSQLQQSLCNYCINSHWTQYVSAWICVGAIIAPTAQTIST